jgi:DNA-binding PadR family transcriptional regulator
MPKNKDLSIGTVMVLHALARGCQYGFDIIEETGLTSGTIYPALEKLERLGYARSEWEDGRIAQREKRPARRYFTITDPGRDYLVSAMERYRSLAPLEIRGTVDPKHSTS